MAGSVSKNTDYLVNNDLLSGSSKNKKAKELGIPIILEEELIRLVKAKNLRLDRVITDVYPFERAAQAFEDFHQNAGSMLKVMIEF